MDNNDSVGYSRIRADVDLDALRYNILQLKKCVNQNVKALAVIKADGYGHGACPIARYIDDLVEYFGVATIDEAMELRKSGVTKDILILGYVPTSEYEKIVEYNFTQTVYDYNDAKKLSDIASTRNKKAIVHIKVDTGMSRIGINPDYKGVKLVEDIYNLPGLVLEGIFSHYAKADEEDKTSAIGQCNIFKEFLLELSKKSIEIPIKHIANSAGIMEMNDDFQMIRLGIAMYGQYPSKEIKKNIVLKPVMTFVAHVSYVKTIPSGTGVSYGWNYFADGDRIIATVTAGYADGYPRAQTNIGRVIVNGEYAPIVGNVCMDQFMIDITNIPNVKVGDEIVLFGNQNGKEITVEEVAQPANSFNYELLCNISRRVTRVYHLNGEIINVVNYLI